MKLSDLVAQLSQLMADYPHCDPDVEMRISTSVVLHDVQGREVGSFDHNDFVDVADVIQVTMREELSGVWLVNQPIELVVE